MVAPTYLRSLQALEMAVRKGSFVAAAEGLGITPAAVGQRVKALEDYLGVELLSRGRAGLRAAPGLESALPHLARAITVVILIETIFLLNVFAEILVTTGGGPGLQTTNIPFLVYAQALLQFDVGGASAGGIVAVILANIVAFFLVRMIGRNLEG